MSKKDLKSILDGTQVSVREVRQYADDSGRVYFYRGTQEFARKVPTLDGPQIIGQPCSLRDVAINGASRFSDGKAYEVRFLPRGRIGEVKLLYSTA